MARLWTWFKKYIVRTRKNSYDERERKNASASYMHFELLSYRRPVGVNVA